MPRGRSLASPWLSRPEARPLRRLPRLVLGRDLLGSRRRFGNSGYRAGGTSRGEVDPLHVGTALKMLDVPHRHDRGHRVAMTLEDDVRPLVGSPVYELGEHLASLSDLVRVLHAYS